MFNQLINKNAIVIFVMSHIILDYIYIYKVCCDDFGKKNNLLWHELFYFKITCTYGVKLIILKHHFNITFAE